MKEIINQAEVLGKAIQESAEYSEYMKAKEIHDRDTDLQVLIGDFNIKRMSIMQEAKKQDKDEAKLAKLNEELREVYEKVMQNENMKAYVAAKEKFDDMVNQVYSLLNFYITGNDSSCSGSCDSCGGCH